MKTPKHKTVDYNGYLILPYQMALSGVWNYQVKRHDTEEVALHRSNALYSTRKAVIDSAKDWIEQNPITVIHELP